MERLNLTYTISSNILNKTEFKNREYRDNFNLSALLSPDFKKKLFLSPDAMESKHTEDIGYCSRAFFKRALFHFKHFDKNHIKKKSMNVSFVKRSLKIGTFSICPYFKAQCNSEYRLMMISKNKLKNRDIFSLSALLSFFNQTKLMKEPKIKTV